MRVKFSFNLVQWYRNGVTGEDAIPFSVRQYANHKAIVTSKIALGCDLRQCAKQSFTIQVLINFDVVTQHEERFGQLVPVDF